jgi:hypothetical protein
MTDTSAQDVIAFYNEQLATKGWVTEWSNDISTVPDRADIGLGYSWSDRAGVLPWDLSLVVSLRDIYDGPTQGLSVELHLSRVPNVDRVPLYPGAQRVQSEWVPSTRWEGNKEKDISYITSASMQDVKSYYKALLPQCGWGGPSEGFEPGDLNEDISRGIKYGWGTGGLHNAMYVGLTITATPISDGKTQVQIKLDGTLNHP